MHFPTFLFRASSRVSLALSGHPATYARYALHPVQTADQIFLATDPDREGEAIAWHVASQLESNKKDVGRVLFHEITPQAVRTAIDKPVPIDMQKVNAQQARRVMDRLVGYQVSPVLWKTITGGLSAGRVQSVALRLICQREEEIEKFKVEEYWSITAYLRTEHDAIFPLKSWFIKSYL